VAVAIRLVRLAGVAAMMPAATNAPTIDHRGRLRLAVAVLGAGVSCTSSPTVRSSRMSRSRWQLPPAPSPRSDRAFARRREQSGCFHCRYTSPRHRLQGQECAPKRSAVVTRTSGFERDDGRQFQLTAIAIAAGKPRNGPTPRR
jgi:hypothetical protein